MARIPLAYNLRNLAVRKTTTLMTALGIGLTVAVLLSVLALVEGLRTAFEANAHPLNVIVLRKGSTAELMSTISRENFQVIRGKAGISRGAGGEPLASLEMATIVNLETPDSTDGINVTLRGLTLAGCAMREQMRIVEGRLFAPGHREAVVGSSIARRFPGGAVGRRIQIGRGQWEISGVMDAGRAAFNSEIFADLNQVASDYNRDQFLSSVLLRAAGPVEKQALIRTLEADPQLNISAQGEDEYYRAQTRSAEPVRFLGLFVAGIMAVGSSFAAMNTMYAAVARRTAEIGVLRVLGFTRAGILASFLLESLAISLLGGVIGCLLVLPLNNVSTAIGSMDTFAQTAFHFRVNWLVASAGIGFGLVMGALGGLFPARSAARKEILAAFREV